MPSRSRFIVFGALVLAGVFALTLVFGRAKPPTFDAYRRLVSFPGKRQIACPPQNERTVVLLAAGQSNMANFAERRYRPHWGDAVVDFFDGRCFAAESPLLGADNEAGEPLTLLGDALIDSGRYDRVVLVPAAIGGMRAEDFARGPLAPMLARTVAALAGRYQPDFILWHQGESDFARRTPPETYAADLQRVFAVLRKGVATPVLVSVATKCLPLRPDWQAANPIAAAQARIVNPARGIYAGIDTDALLDERDRIDSCHLSWSGQEKVAAAWRDAITAVPR